MMPVIAALLLLPAFAAAEQPDDFAAGISLRTSDQAAFHQLDVPRAVYEGVTRADLGDVRVFNAAGEIVPHAFRPRAATIRRTLPPAAIPLFPIHTDAPAGVGEVAVRLERRGGRTVIDLRTSDGQPVRGATLVGYVADARAVDTAIQAVTLRLPAHTEQLVARVTLEASDDLRRWGPLATGAPVVRLSAGDERLEQLRIEVPARKAKYLRVSWPGRSEAIVVAGLEVEIGDATVEAPRQWSPMMGTTGKKRPGEHEYDLKGYFPVDRLRVALPQPNTVAALEVLSRARAADPWRRVMTATTYRLARGGDELTSADLEIDLNSDRFWLVKVDPRGGGVGTGPLGLAAGWLPHRLIFAARGPGPFQLAYGRRDAKSTAFPIAALVPGYRSEADLELRPGQAGAPPVPIGLAQPAERPQGLGGKSALRPRIDWKRWMLWGSLVLGVLLLGWMAMRLGRQLSRPPSEPVGTKNDPPA